MHANARLTERCRRELVALVVGGMAPTEAAVRFGVSRTTVYRWVGRARSGESRWWVDRSSAPRHSPNRVSGEITAKILELRKRWGLSPVRIAASPP
jgi:transposase